MLLDLVYLILRGEILNVALFSLATSDKLCNNVGQVQYVLRISALRRKLRGLNFVNQCLPWIWICWTIIVYRLADRYPFCSTALQVREPSFCFCSQC